MVRERCLPDTSSDHGYSNRLQELGRSESVALLEWTPVIHAPLIRVRPDVSSSPPCSTPELSGQRDLNQEH
jgi:hypothetical protein